MPQQRESNAGAGPRTKQCAELFARFRVPLLRYLTDLLSRRDEAEDIVQETYVRLMQVEAIDDGRARALIFKIATNLAYDRFRQRKTRGPHGDVEQLDALPSSSPAPDNIVALEQGVEIVKRTLLELKPRCRQVFLLRTSEELEYDDIAARLGVSRRTVEREMQHALDVIQRRLGVEKKK
jgi:RNA polymerase sigma-70 factor (ECF subfamily)